MKNLIATAALLGITVVGGKVMYDMERDHCIQSEMIKTRFEKSLADFKGLTSHPEYNGELDELILSYERLIATLNTNIFRFYKKWNWLHSLTK